MDTIAVPTDFIGLNYYGRNLHRVEDPNNDLQIFFPHPKTPEHWTEMDWEVYPDGLIQKDGSFGIVVTFLQNQVRTWLPESCLNCVPSIAIAMFFTMGGCGYIKDKVSAGFEGAVTSSSAGTVPGSIASEW